MRAAFALLALFAAPAAADPIVLRFATVAPEGSPWARETQAFARNVEARSEGQVHIKWYLGGVAGDELEQGERIRRGQLAGSATGQMLCERIAPSLRIARLPGVFQDRDEAAYVMNRLQPALAAEAHQAGFILASNFGIGPDVLFTRRPVKSMAELRKLRLWHWDLDEVGIATSRAMGLEVVPLPIAEAARAYDEGRIDGFFAIPSAALAFQWSARATYVIDLRRSYIWGCLIWSEAQGLALAPELQRALGLAAGAVQPRIEAAGRETDDALLGGLFAKQGLQVLAVDEGFREEFFASARAARERVGARYVRPQLLDQVLRMLADFRAEHRR